MKKNEFTIKDTDIRKIMGAASVVMGIAGAILGVKSIQDANEQERYDENRRKVQGD